MWPILGPVYRGQKSSGRLNNLHRVTKLMSRKAGHQLRYPRVPKGPHCHPEDTDEVMGLETHVTVGI